MVDKFKMSIDDNIDYAKRVIVDSIYKEAQVEGINITFPQTQQIYDGIMLHDFSYEDTTKIINLKRAWYFILNSLEYPFDIRYLRHLNSIIQNGLMKNAGVIREIGVRISGTNWCPEIPTHESIEKELDRLRKIENPTQRSLELMLSVMRGQYFEDGNKRTAQLIANHEMINNGAGIISIPVERKTEFGDLLVDYYESNKKDTIMDFLYSECVSGFTRSKEIDMAVLEEQKKEDETIINQFMKKHKR